jgi:RNA polymerase sigma-70 factor (ECF subfamily)
MHSLVCRHREEQQMQATNAHTEGEQGRHVRPGRESARQFDDVLSRHLPAFQRMAFRKLGNTADAEDAVQDALLSAYKHLDQFNGQAQMSTWLTTIVINSARMRSRKRSRRFEVSLDAPFDDDQQNWIAERIADDSPSPEDVCRESELHERVRKFSTQLSLPLRSAFQLRDLDGLTTKEAALILGVPDGTVKAQLTRARAKLREFMRRSPHAKSTSGQTSTPVTTIKATSLRRRQTSAARDRQRRALPQHGALRARIPEVLETERQVA